MPSILHGVIREGRGRSLRQAQDRSQPQVGTAFPPKRNFIVTPRFATYKVGTEDAKAAEDREEGLLPEAKSLRIIGSSTKWASPQDAYAGAIIYR